MTKSVMTNSAINWTSSGVTDSGKVRRWNEDAFLDKPESGLWVVADGMGGHNAGDLASSLIVKTLARSLTPESLSEATQAVTESLNKVNTELVGTARERNQSMIGSTVVILLVRENRFACSWAGDSRLYRLRQGIFEQITRDHSEVQNLIDYGIINKAESENHPSANIITRAVGAMEGWELDTVQGDILPGDKLLLCSDGLYRELTEREMAQSMQFGGQPEGIVANLLSLALTRPAKDNITAIAISFSSAS